MHRSARTLTAITALTAVVLLGACDPGVGPAPTPTATASAAAPDPEAVVETRTVAFDGVAVEVTVHPLVRAGEHVVLTVDYLATEPSADGQILTAISMGAVGSLGTLVVGGVRLLDLAQDTVHEPGSDAKRWPVEPDDAWQRLEEGVPARMQLAYAAPPATTDHLTLLLPGTYLVPDVPVIDADVPAPTVPAAGGPTPSGSSTGAATAETSEDEVAPIDLGTVEIAPVYPLTSYTWQRDGGAATREEVDRIEIAVDSDVLFAPDSADLTPDAQRVVDLASEQLRTRGTGTVTVVGHTDSVDDDAHNLDLSQRRAAAVAAALGALLDPAGYPVQAEGRGEGEPVADNATDDGRRRNRRVEITLLAERQADTVIDATGALPPAPELTATGAEGVLVEAVRPWTVQAPRAELVDGHLAVELLVTAADDDVDSSFGAGFLNSVWDVRPDAATPSNHMAYGVVLAQGRTAMTTLDYGVPLTTGTGYVCACELDTLVRTDGGTTRSMTLVYPAVGTPTSVTLENLGGLGAVPFRLTDIPVIAP